MADSEKPGERTALAGDRTMLSNERTLAAWWRTAMSALALALGFAKLFGGVEPAWLVRTGATLLILLGLIVLRTALRTFQRTADSIETEHVVAVSRRTVWTGTLLLGVVAAICGSAIWLA